MIAYLLTNTLRGLSYVGVTSKPLARRWSEHKAAAFAGSSTALHQAIRQDGSDAFSIQVIACALSVEALFASEVILIRQQGSKMPDGYNMTDGGNRVAGLEHNEDSRRKISAATRGLKRSEKTKRKISAAHKGKILGPEHRAKMALAKLGRKLGPFTEEHCRRISEARMGHGFSPETLLKMSQAKKGKPWTEARRRASHPHGRLLQ